MSKPGETLTPTLFSDLFRSELEEIVAKAVRAVKLVFPGAKVVDRVRGKEEERQLGLDGQD